MQNIFNHSLLKKRQELCRQTFDKSPHIFYHICNTMLQNIADLKNFTPNKILHLGSKNKYMANALNKQFCNAQIYCVDHANYANSLALSPNEDKIHSKIISKVSNIHSATFNVSAPNWLQTMHKLSNRRKGYFNLIVAPMCLHNLNNIDEIIQCIAKMLAKDGILMFNIFGDKNLKELKSALLNAEESIFGAVSPRVNPTITMQNVASLVKNAGLQNIVCDRDEISTQHNSVISLCKMLKNTGENSIMTHKNSAMFSRELFNKCSANYKTNKESPKITATFDIIYCFASK